MEQDGYNTVHAKLGVQHIPRLVIILRKFKLVLCNDVGILIKDDESYGAAGSERNESCPQRDGHHLRRASIECPYELALVQRHGVNKDWRLALFA